MNHAAALLTHLALVTASVLLFSLRFALMLSGSRALQHRSWRVLPHVVDTALLASGVWLIVLTRQYPLTTDWLTAKVSTVAELDKALADIESHDGAVYVEVLIPNEESQPLPEDVIDRAYKLRTPR